MSKDEELQRAPYQEWMKEEGMVESVKQGIKRSGVPLEARARQAFGRAGLTAGRHHYYDAFDEQVPLREIDLQAEYSTLGMDLAQNKEVGILASVLGECKYSSSKDWFVFHASAEKKAWFNTGSYPPGLNGQWLLWQDSGNDDSDLPTASSILSRLPTLSEQIVEADAWRPMTRKEGNYSTATIHTACSQLHSAAVNSLRVHRLLLQSRYKEVASAIGLIEQWQAYVSAKWPNLGLPIPDFVLREFLDETFWRSAVRPMAEGEFLYVAMAVPLILIDDTRGLVSVELDSQGDITGFTDLGVCLYLHAPERRRDRNNLQSAANAFPVLIANLSHADEVLQLVQGILWELHRVANRRVQADQRILAGELLSYLMTASSQS